MKPFLMGFVYAFRGLAQGLKGQRNIKVMIGLALLAGALGVWLDISRVEWAVVSLACGLVLSLELMNTAQEKLVDILSPEIDPRYGQVKDILAAAVLVASAFAAVAGGFVFLPYLLERI
jgi:diacylglycerol kinase